MQRSVRQSVVTRGDILNEKKSFNHFPEKAKTKRRINFEGFLTIYGDKHYQQAASVFIAK